MNKSRIVDRIIAKLEADVLLYQKAARSSHAEATHEQNKAENKYDTRGLEAAYLAGAQARQALEVENTLSEISKLRSKKFRADEGADVGALIEVDMAGEISCFLLASRGGGTEVAIGKREVLVLTPQSPLGQELMGKRAGDKFRFKIGPATNHYSVLSVA